MAYLGRETVQRVFSQSFPCSVKPVRWHARPHKHVGTRGLTSVCVCACGFLGISTHTNTHTRAHTIFCSRSTTALQLQGRLHLSVHGTHTSMFAAAGDVQARWAAQPSARQQPHARAAAAGTRQAVCAGELGVWWCMCHSV